MLAAASCWRPLITPEPPEAATDERGGKGTGYRRWAELLARTFAVDVLACPSCYGRMRLLSQTAPGHTRDPVPGHQSAVPNAAEGPPQTPVKIRNGERTALA